ncbi:hypothetical protein M569_01478, partial [Genlisea aurea]
PQPAHHQIYPIPDFQINSGVFSPYLFPNIVPQNIPYSFNPFIFSQFPDQRISEINVSQPSPSDDASEEIPPPQGTAWAEMLEKIDKLVSKAWADLLGTNKHVSVWNASKEALLMLKANSWKSLSNVVQQVPSLSRLARTESKVNAFILCFIAVEKITSLYELEIALCKSEGVSRYEELELGPLFRHPIVMKYFSLSGDLTQVYRIRTEQIISYLHEFIKTHKNDKPSRRKFLNFMSDKESVSCSEKLCIRIENFRLKSVAGKRDQRTRVVDMKKEIDVHFEEITQRVKTFSTFSSQFCGKHVRFSSPSSDEDNEKENNLNSENAESDCSIQLPNAATDCAGSCPYPSATEERMRLRKKNVDPNHGSSYVDKEIPQRKRISTLYTLPYDLSEKGLYERHPKRRKACGMSSPSDSHESWQMFCSTWKDACKSNSAEEVFEMMLKFYNTVSKRRKVIKLFQCYPFSGLLMAAVMFIRSGAFNDVSNASQTLGLEGVDNRSIESSDAHMSIDAEELTAKAVVISSLENLCHKPDAEDVLVNISGYFENELFCCKTSSMQHKLQLLKNLCMTEKWLTEQYYVDDFESLGHGDYFMFLEKYMHRLPHGLQKFFTEDVTDGVSLEAHLLPIQLEVLLSQVLNCLEEGQTISLQTIAKVLAEQFPLAGFKLVNGHLTENFLGILQERKYNLTSSCEAKSSEFLCLVTKEGKVIRINHLASIDSFVKVFIQGSASGTALELLSLVALYGGQHNVPFPLLKSHAQRAFTVLINDYLENEPKTDRNPIQLRCPPYEHDVVSNISSANLAEKSLKSAHRNVASVFSKFILDCLSYLPIEFCSFAADIMISALQHFVKDTPKVILTECKDLHLRLMLHEVGMTLGITDWVLDYHSIFSSASVESANGKVDPDCPLSSSNGMVLSHESDGLYPRTKDGSGEADTPQTFFGNESSQGQIVHDCHFGYDPAMVVDSIRKEEFGIDHCSSATENKMLEKQHSRLGRALHCLSQELYSHDSHFLLELVQNADDNIYAQNLVPTLVFILQDKAIILLNNEKGFSDCDVRSLCDIGNSAKRNRKAGFIGKKGIGFKSVFRVTDSPEIHSNGFHIKFDTTNGPIGFVLPTVVSPCDVQFYARLASADACCLDQNLCNTCILLPLKSSLSEVSASNILSMFSDLHPSLLLFLRRLQCIKFRNMLDDTYTVMRKDVRGNGIVHVSLGNRKMTWFVATQQLKPDVILSDIRQTEISVAFTLKELDEGEYAPILEPQPVFAFLPLRMYGLKFIVQGDFVLPSSREDVDVNSPLNQWLLSEVPDLFVRAQRLFCDLPCYKTCPGKAVNLFLKFVPMVGEVHGFFSSLPRFIISKLRLSNCLVLEGDNKEWVPPCKALRNWNNSARSLLPDSLLQEHLGLGFLDKDIVLSDSLARALGVEEYGPKLLLRVLSSLCSLHNGLNSLGLSWLLSWLDAVHVMLSSFSSHTSSSFDVETDLIQDLRNISFIPLADGTYSSLNENVIWLHYDGIGHSTTDGFIQKYFPKLLGELRFVSPQLLDAASSTESSYSGGVLGNAIQMLLKVGIQRLSAHEILMMHVIPALSRDTNAMGQGSLMVEYLAFAMFHLLSGCTLCSLERERIIVELQKNALILTNFGYKRLSEVPIHFGVEYGNSVQINKLITGLDIKWHEIESAYLQHPVTDSACDGILRWRKFFQEVGVTDFVQIVQVDKKGRELSLLIGEDCGLPKSVNDWESEELRCLLSMLSSRRDGQKSKYLLEILNLLWDDDFKDKAAGSCIYYNGESKPFKSSLICMLQDFPWISSTMNDKLNYPSEVYHDCAAITSILGISAPYAIPKVSSEKLIAEIGLKTKVTLDDALSVLRLWRSSEAPLKASVSQMSNFYSFIWKGMVLSKTKVVEELHLGPFIFIPDATSYSFDDVVPGRLFSPQDVYWRDAMHFADQARGLRQECHFNKKKLCDLYVSLHDFFVNECGVEDQLSLCSYLEILRHLSETFLPHEVAKKVFDVFAIWGDALKSGSLSSQDIEYLKQNLLKKECTVLPTKQDRWVSLHSSFGQICWCDDDGLRREFEHLEGVNFLYFVDPSCVLGKVSNVMRELGIPALSEV